MRKRERREEWEGERWVRTREVGNAKERDVHRKHAQRVKSPAKLKQQLGCGPSWTPELCLRAPSKLQEKLLSYFARATAKERVLHP